MATLLSNNVLHEVRDNEVRKVLLHIMAVQARLVKKIGKRVPNPQMGAVNSYGIHLSHGDLS